MINKNNKKLMVFLYRELSIARIMPIKSHDGDGQCCHILCDADISNTVDQSQKLMVVSFLSYG